MWKRIIFIIILFSNSANAGFLQLVSKSIEQCQKKHNIHSIGGVPFATLLDELKKVNWAIPGLLLSGSGGLRHSGVNFQEIQTAFINVSIIQNARGKFIDGFLLHEGLGALGYDDDETYDKSLAISFCAHSDSSEHVRRIIGMTSPLQKRTQPNTYIVHEQHFAENRAGGRERSNSRNGRSGRGGSSTVVGGDGGDLEVFHLKLFLLLRYPVWHQKKSRNLENMYAGMNKLLHLKIESSHAPIRTFIKGDPIDDFFFWDPEQEVLRLNRIWPSNIIAQEATIIFDQLDRFLF